MATLSLLRFAPLPPRLTRPSLAVNPTLLRPNPSIKIRPRLPPISASSSMVPSTDRLISAISYTLPFFTSLPFRRSRYPLLASLASPFSPTVTAIAEVVAFFAVLLGLAHPEMSVFVRFNARQAMLLDMILTSVVLAEKAFGTPSDQVGVKFVQFVHGAVYVLGLASFVYSVLCCVVGRTPYLPFLSSVAKFML